MKECEKPRKRSLSAKKRPTYDSKQTNKYKTSIEKLKKKIGVKEKPNQ